MIIEVSNLVKTYERNKISFHAVNNVSMKIKEGQLICIVGHSGCGKTTLLNMLAGLIRPSSGSILIDNEDILKKNDRELSFLRNKTIGYVLQGQGLLNNFSIIDNICMPQYLSDCKENLLCKASNLLEQVDLKGTENNYPSVLSGGEMRRVAIARSLINSPKLIIADEPTSNLDPDNSMKIMQLFSKITQNGTTVIMSTHDLEFLDYANKVYHMKNGVLSEDSL